MNDERIQGLILRKQDMYYTHMDVIFRALGNIEKNYNWLISDYECNLYTEPFSIEKRDEYLWLSGEDLSNFVNGNNYTQFIWGSFAAFGKGITLDEILAFPIPRTTEGLFNDKELKMQHPLSTLEIVAIDSGSVIMLSKNPKYIESFTVTFLLAEEINILI